MIIRIRLSKGKNESLFIQVLHVLYNIVQMVCIMILLSWFYHPNWGFSGERCGPWITCLLLPLIIKIFKTCMQIFTNKVYYFTISANVKLSVAWNSGKKELTVTWDNIFWSPLPLYYEVSAGTVEGGADILQWQETTSTRTVFVLPPSVINWSGLHVHVFVRAITVGGTHSDIKGYIQLPKWQKFTTFEICGSSW